MARSLSSAAAYDAALASLLRVHADVMPKLTALREADPACTKAHVLAGAVPMLACMAKFLAASRAALAAARTGSANAREQMHVAALDAWTRGDIDGAITGWGAILAAHPRDLLALFLAHNSNFWLGRPQDMRASVERVRGKWSADVPGFGAMLACRCFADEECGDYLAAEPDGRRAVAEDSENFWATHAVAHILEMQARRAEGVDWLEGLAPHWRGANNLRHHFSWHRALYHLERGPSGDARRARLVGGPARRGRGGDALGALATMGGSHAQQDVLEQIFVHRAPRAGLAQDAALAIERFAGQRRMSPAAFLAARAANVRSGIIALRGSRPWEQKRKPQPPIAPAFLPQTIAAFARASPQSSK